MPSKDIGSTTSNESTPKSIVCVHTQVDEPLYRELQTYLSLWQREGYVQWLEISAGSDRDLTMQAHLQQAHLILLLISADFFAEDHCYRAMHISLQEQARRQVPVVPILARASAWQTSACGHLRALPGNEQPIAQWVHPEQAFEEIYVCLARLLPDDFRRKLIQETTSPRANLAASRESEETQKQDSPTPAYTLNFDNQGAKIGQQGTFSGNTTINFD